MNIIKKHCLILLLTMLAILASCSYDEHLDTYNVEVRLSENVDGVTIKMTNSIGSTFEAATDADGIACFTLPAGIYSVSASKVTDDEYFRHICNGALSDVAIGCNNTAVELPVSITAMQTANPILIKELYNGGCQKDDGSGKFAIDKCIILYNNSSETVSLDNVGFGIVEPYNAEANTHSFLNGGKLDYADTDWIPALNGIWYFQQGCMIAPYSELVVNVHGAIDNTQTYSNSINYANAAYYCMYDVEATSSDGGKYNNTMYYPSPADVISTSHYLKAVKYGKGNAWAMSQTSPAVILFRTEDITPKEFGENTANIIYPTGKEGNIVYACLKMPRIWVIDALEVYNATALANCKKRLTPDLDNGYATLTGGYGHSLIRKVEKTVDGHAIYQDTNNSTNDFYEADNCSLR
jgi:hypothetical protein